MIITDGPIEVKDINGKELSVGDEVYMWRPLGIDKARIVKYNSSTGHITVEAGADSSLGVNRKFGTPYDRNKFAII